MLNLLGSSRIIDRKKVILLPTFTVHKGQLENH